MTVLGMPDTVFALLGGAASGLVLGFGLGWETGTKYVHGVWEEWRREELRREYGAGPASAAEKLAQETLDARRHAEAYAAKVAEKYNRPLP